jgi:hypothetical protein
MGITHPVYQHKAGEYDDATGPIRDRKVYKATNLELLRGDIVALGTGLALKATDTTKGPFAVVKHTVLAAEAKNTVEVYIDTKATLYVKAGGVIKAECYVKVASTNKVVAWVGGTDTDTSSFLLGRYVRHGETNYDGVTPLQDAADTKIIGIILGSQ